MLKCSKITEGVEQMKSIVAKYTFGDMDVTLVTDGGPLGLELYPSGEECQGEYRPESLIQVHIDGDEVSGGYASGITMRNSMSSRELRYDGHDFIESADEKTLTVRLKSPNNRSAVLKLTHRKGESALRVRTVFSNNSDTAVDLQMLSSFSFGGIIPSKGTLLHRLRSKWSSEGRLVSDTLENLQLEPTWARHGVHSEKFGQNGSLPVRNFFPWMAVEDKRRGLIWGAALAVPGSWQMEAYRRDNALSLSGGLADFETGHWMKRLESGQSFEAPEAYITVCRGDVDDVSARLVSVQKPFEGDLPVVFNEYLATGGAPTEETVRKLLSALDGHDFDYFVIDAGWYGSNELWSRTQGDWNVNTSRFPNGMRVVADMIHAHGLKAGIWFEFEVCAQDSKAYALTDHLLKKNGKVINVAERRFWDMRDPWVKDYLKKRVADFLRDNGFDYIKVDYNDSIGIGCDGAESPGEGLRQVMEASQDFFRLIKREVPGIMIENCASGGHRLEPSFLEICGTASFSDAHFTKDIPIIAANLHRAMQPSKSQIWAVLRASDPEVKLRYTMVNTLLGVPCISGRIDELSPRQWELVDDFLKFYRKVSPVIRNGKSRIYANYAPSTANPEGWQAVVRKTDDEGKALVVFDAFEWAGGGTYAVPVGTGYRLDAVCAGEGDLIRYENGFLSIRPQEDMSACAAYLVSDGEYKN